MATTRTYTIEELETDPPEGEWELIDGALIPMVPSGFESSSIAARITRIIGNHVEEHDLGEVTGADGGYVIFSNRQTLRVPDVAFVRTERLPAPAERRGFARLAPDLAVEVLSPSNRPIELFAKVEMYREAGIPLIWLVDPEEKTVTVIAAGKPTVTLHAGDTLDGGAVLPGFNVPVARLFG
ncbi:MAG: Uma2 family endonuclease [Thermomicrobiales bacterium]